MSRVGQPKKERKKPPPKPPKGTTEFIMRGGPVDGQWLRFVDTVGDTVRQNLGRSVYRRTGPNVFTYEGEIE